MTMEDAHRRVARTAGMISLALINRKLAVQLLERAIEDLETTLAYLKTLRRPT